MPYSITPPPKMPTSGMRDLTPRETMQRARAIACIRKKDPAQCGGQVYVSLFFDGTGNNMDWEEPGLGTTQMAAGNIAISLTCTRPGSMTRTMDSSPDICPMWAPFLRD